MLSLLYKLLPSTINRINFILFSAFSLTVPFLIALILSKPPSDELVFFYSLPIIFSIINGIYGAVYYKFFKNKSDRK